MASMCSLIQTIRSHISILIVSSSKRGCSAPTQLIGNRAAPHLDPGGCRYRDVDGEVLVEWGFLRTKRTEGIIRRDLFHNIEAR
jgi:hypothetical protein